jgi:hypothetical protein
MRNRRRNKRREAASHIYMAQVVPGFTDGWGPERVILGSQKQKDISRAVTEWRRRYPYRRIREVRL